jgi:hypothetical protein
VNWYPPEKGFKEAPTIATLLGEKRRPREKSSDILDKYLAISPLLTTISWSAQGLAFSTSNILPIRAFLFGYYPSFSARGKHKCRVSQRLNRFQKRITFPTCLMVTT